MSDRLRIIVTGLIAQYPLGGVTWDYIQYVAGLARLGHDVYYIEDTGQWPYNPDESGIGKDCTYNVEYLARVMSRFGLEERWAYRFPWESKWFGLSDERREEVVTSSDLLINVSGTLERPQDYRSARRMAYIDSDPVFTQVKLARGQRDLRAMIDVHDVHFSFGERIGAFEPETGHAWQPTRQPILLDQWTNNVHPRDAFTTVMNWTSYNEVTHDGTTYTQKDVEFRRFIDLPAAVTPTQLEVAMAAGRTRHAPHDLLKHHGWKIVDPAQVCATLDDYRAYLQGSRAEWSVAKGGYVSGQAAWFSCRSACYLAAGRPVVVQDTGFGAVLPVGLGIVPFATRDEAIAGIRAVDEHYAAHADAAREIAEQYFDSTRVLGALVEQAMAPITSRELQETAP